MATSAPLGARPFGPKSGNQARSFATIFDLVDKFGAEFATDPPCQTALARMVGREDEGELRRDFQILGDHLHTAGRYVGDGAVARQRTCTALDFCDSSAQTTFASASISKHSNSHYGADGSSGASGIPPT